MDEMADNPAEGSRCSTLECKNLEVRGTWSGDLGQPTDLKISIEVESSKSVCSLTTIYYRS